MVDVSELRAPYIVPRYRVEGLPSWYHFLHGTVPGHQIDFMYCPEVPQGRLTQTHFGHLARLMKYIEPRESAPYAFALGNLSRDDVQHEPGHGGVALIFALRVVGVTDHAGRAMPPYAHGAVAIDRALDYVTLLEAASVFYRRFLDRDTEAQDATGSFYRTYARVMSEHPEGVEKFLRDYVADFDELPQPGPSKLGWDWLADEESTPRRVTIVHADEEPFTTVAHVASSLAAMLYRSNIKWTTITSGREIEIPGGTSVRFVPESDAPRDPRGLLVHLDDLSDDEAVLAERLFGARPRDVEAKPARAGWREALGARGAPAAGVAHKPSTGPSSRPQPVRSAPPPRIQTPVPPAEPDNAPTIRTPPPHDAALAAPFDPRRSSPITGMAAPFDPRRSSPITGIAAAGIPRTEPPATAALAPMSLPDSAPPPDIELPFAPEARSRVGLWIGVVGGLGAVVAILVAVAAAMSAEDGPGTDAPAPPGSQLGMPPAGSMASPTQSATSATAPPAAAPEPAPTADPSATATASAAPVKSSGIPTGKSRAPKTVPPAGKAAGGKKVTKIGGDLDI